MTINNMIIQVAEAMETAKQLDIKAYTNYNNKKYEIINLEMANIKMYSDIDNHLNFYVELENNDDVRFININHITNVFVE